jgi:hypothetical protein
MVTHNARWPTYSRDGCLELLGVEIIILRPKEMESVGAFGRHEVKLQAMEE